MNYYIDKKGGRVYRYNGETYSGQQLVNHLMHNKGMTLAEAIAVKDGIKRRD